MEDSNNINACSAGTPDSAEICTALCAFIAELLEDRAVSVAPNDRFDELGIDSFLLIELVLFLERKFQRPLPLEMLTPGNTCSAQNLAEAYVKSRALSQGASPDSTSSDSGSPGCESSCGYPDRN